MLLPLTLTLVLLLVLMHTAAIIMMTVTTRLPTQHSTLVLAALAVQQQVQQQVQLMMILQQQCGLRDSLRHLRTPAVAQRPLQEGRLGGGRMRRQMHRSRPSCPSRVPRRASKTCRRASRTCRTAAVAVAHRQCPSMLAYTTAPCPPVLKPTVTPPLLTSLLPL